MIWHSFPPLNSLRAFSVLARAGSYSRAGAELHVTHAAVSQQVRLLEERLGVALVVRDGRGIRITPEGFRLAQALDTGFSAIRDGLKKIRKSGDRLPVQLSSSPAFAMEWLMPRIQDFQNRYPEIPLMINPTSSVVDLEPGGVELAIRYGDKRTIAADVVPVLISDMVVIAAPSVVNGLDVRNPADLVNIPWLQELGTNEVAEWFARRNFTLDRPLMVTQMPGNLIMQAVRRGDGVTYTAHNFFENEIKSGAMKVLFSEKKFGIYHIVTCTGTLHRSVQTFLEWLREQAQ